MSTIIKKLETIKANAKAVEKQCDDLLKELTKAQKPKAKQGRVSDGRALAIANNMKRYQ